MPFRILFLSLILLLGLNANLAANPLDKEWAAIKYNKNLGVSGVGVVIGVGDSAFESSHPSFNGKIKGSEGNNSLNYDIDKSGKFDESDASNIQHGTHVAGIILGADLGDSKPHGLAYNASFYGFANITDSSFVQTTKVSDFFKNKGIKIINHSWGPNVYPLIGKQIDNSSAFVNYSLSGGNVQAYENGEPIKSLVDLARNDKILQVMAAGNEGMRAPSLAASLPSYDESLRSWIAVGAIDANNIQISGDKITLNPQKQMDPNKYVLPQTQLPWYYMEGGAVGFSNSFGANGEAALYGLLAPGHNISSANAYYNSNLVDGFSTASNPCNDKTKEFCTKSGTSQATPFVAGAAALVAEKFSFLNGAQIADVLLSTANSNIELPKIIIKTTDIYEGNAWKVKYDIIYTENVGYLNDTKAGGQVEKDLIAQGFTQSQAQDMLNNLLWNNGAIYMEKEALIGQGMLDITKALGGLARIDANRMLDSDVDAQDSTKAYYTINLGNSSAEFSNDISERKWEQKYHKNEAINKQDKLKAVQNLGLKIQNGTLILSGKNSTYTGDTIIESGALNLKGGELKNSRVVVQNGSRFVLENGSAKAAQNLGTMSGIGKITGDLENSGTLRAGFYNENNGIVSDTINGGEKIEVGGKFTQTQNGTLQMAFTKNGGGAAINTQLQAAQYDIKGGNLEYLPTQTADGLIRPDETITPSVGGLNAVLGQFGSVSAKETNSLEFEVSPDKTSFTAKLKNGAFDPNAGGGGGSGSGGSSGGGGSGGSSSGSGSGGSSSGGGSGGSQGGNSSANSTIAQALGAMFSRNISGEYNAAFATLENLTPSEYQKSVKSLHESPNEAAKSAMDTAQKALNIKSLVFLLNPSDVNFAPTAALGSDFLFEGDYNNDFSRDFSKTKLSLGTSYRFTNADEYRQNAFLFDLQAKKEISQSTNLSAFIGTGLNTTKQDNSELKSTIFSAGIGAAHDFGGFGILGGVSGGFGKNDLSQNAANLANTDTKADYNNYFFRAQGGVFVPIDLAQNARLSPVFLADFNYFSQDKFSQSGGLFSREYEPINDRFWRVWAGVNASYRFENTGAANITLSAFGFYWHRFGENKEQFMRFIDAPDLRISSISKAERNGFYGGLSLLAAWDSFYLQASISDEISNVYNQLEFMLRLGLIY